MLQKDIANLDFSTIAALQQKRTLAFVNHFVLTTVQFLNNFAKTCELKLMNFERKLEKVEASMVLLEARLSSIPEVSTIQETITRPQEALEKAGDVKSDEVDDGNKVETEEVKDEPKSQAVQSRPEYDRFVKMVNVGVPLQAVKLKVSLEGLDPNVLEQIINK